MTTIIKKKEIFTGLLSTLLVVSSSVSCLSASPNNVQMRSYEQLPPLVQDALTNMSGADLDNFIEGITFNPARSEISYPVEYCSSEKATLAVDVMQRYRDNSIPFESFQWYFDTFYSHYSDWTLTDSISVEDRVGSTVVDVNGVNEPNEPKKHIYFPKEIFVEASKEVYNIENGDYGGCAIVGAGSLIQFAAKRMGFRSLLNDCESYDNQLQVIVDLMRATPRYNLGDNSILVLPNDLANGLNTVISNRGIDSNLLSAEEIGLGNTGEVSFICEIIMKGVPVLFYAGVLPKGTVSNSSFDRHYVTLDSYEVWNAKDKNGNYFEREFYLVGIQTLETEIA